MGSSLQEFIPDTSMTKKIISVGKYLYVRIIIALLPTETTHIIFAPFLEANIRGQFRKDTKIDTFPHKAIVRT
ncbi:MAG: hypothetical protein WAW59_01540 [Patescibacteria group bacterium]